MTRLPLRNLNAVWIDTSSHKRAGIAFDCPVCDDQHVIALGVADQTGWATPLYKMSETTLTSISLFPTIIGQIYSRFCHFRGWVKLGHVEFIDVNNKRVTHWSDIPDDSRDGE